MPLGSVGICAWAHAGDEFAERKLKLAQRPIAQSVSPGRNPHTFNANPLCWMFRSVPHLGHAAFFSEVSDVSQNRGGKRTFRRQVKECLRTQRLFGQLLEFVAAGLTRNGLSATFRSPNVEVTKLWVCRCVCVCVCPIGFLFGFVCVLVFFVFVLCVGVLFCVWVCLCVCVVACLCVCVCFVLLCGFVFVRVSIFVSLCVFMWCCMVLCVLCLCACFCVCVCFVCLRLPACLPVCLSVRPSVRLTD